MPVNPNHNEYNNIGNVYAPGAPGVYPKQDAGYRKLESLWGPPSRTVDQQGLDHRREISIYPDAWRGPNKIIENIIITLLQAQDYYPCRELMKLTEHTAGLVIEWDGQIFNDHLMTHTPPLGVPRLVSTQMFKNRDQMMRYSIGVQLEWDFWSTRAGQITWAHHLIQVSNAIHVTLNLSVMMALMNPAYNNLTKMERFPGFSDTEQRQRFIEGRFSDMFCFQKGPDHPWNTLKRHREGMQSRISKMGDTIVIPPSTENYFVKNDNFPQWNLVNESYNSYGSKGDATSGLVIYRSSKYPQGYNSPDIKPLSSQRVLAHMAFMEVQEHLAKFMNMLEEEGTDVARRWSSMKHCNIRLYNERADEMATIDYLEALKHAGLFYTLNERGEEYGSDPHDTENQRWALTPYGRQFFAGFTEWGPYIRSRDISNKKLSHYDLIVKAISRSPRYYNSFTKRFETIEEIDIKGAYPDPEEYIKEQLHRLGISGGVVPGASVSLLPTVVAPAHAPGKKTPPGPLKQLFNLMEPLHTTSTGKGTYNIVWERITDFLCNVNETVNAIKDANPASTVNTALMVPKIREAVTPLVTGQTPNWSLFSDTVVLFLKNVLLANDVVDGKASTPNEFVVRLASGKLYEVNATKVRLSPDVLAKHLTRAGLAWGKLFTPASAKDLINNPYRGALFNIITKPQVDRQSIMVDYKDLDDNLRQKIKADFPSYPMGLEAYNIKLGRAMSDYIVNDMRATGGRLHNVEAILNFIPSGIPATTIKEDVVSGDAAIYQEPKRIDFYNRVMAAHTAGHAAVSMGFNPRPAVTTSFEEFARIHDLQIHELPLQSIGTDMLAIHKTAIDRIAAADRYLASAGPGEKDAAMVNRSNAIAVLDTIVTKGFKVIKGAVKFAVEQNLNQDLPLTAVAAYLNELYSNVKFPSDTTSGIFSFLESKDAKHVLAQDPSKAGAIAALEVLNVYSKWRDSKLRAGNMSSQQAEHSATLREMTKGLAYEAPKFVANNPAEEDKRKDWVRKCLNKMPITFHLLDWCYTESMIPILNLGLLRQGMYQVSSMILLQRGEVGYTFYARPNVFVAVNIAQQLISLHASIWSKAIVINPKAVMPIQDVYCEQYLGGNGIKFYNPLSRTDVDNYHSGKCEKDIFVIPFHVDERMSEEPFFDITGEMPEALRVSGGRKENFFSSASIYNGIWGWRHSQFTSPINNMPYEPESMNKMSTLVARDMYMVAGGRGTGVGNDDFFGKVIESKGPWAEFIWPGNGKVRNLQGDKYFKRPSLSSTVMY